MDINALNAITPKLKAAYETTHRGQTMKLADAERLAEVALAAYATDAGWTLAVIRAGIDLGYLFDQPSEFQRLLGSAFGDLRKERMEELVEAIKALNPHNQDPDRANVLFDVMWAAICHQTERAGRFYEPNTPEGRLYHLLGNAFNAYGQRYA